MTWLRCPDCGSFLFKLLLSEDEDNVNAFCLDCENEGRTKKPHFVMTGLYAVQGCSDKKTDV